MNFIIQYWIQWLFGLIIAGMTALFGYILKFYKEQNALKDGMRAILHDKIIQKCKKHLMIGWVTPEDLEELDYLNEPYKELKGNGTAKKMIERVKREWNCKKNDRKSFSITYKERGTRK